MVQWNDEGIVLDALKYGDHDAIVTVFTRERGLCRGVLKGGTRSKQRAMIEPGNKVQVEWNARLSEHLGTWHMELREEIAARVLSHRLKLTALGSLCAMLKLSLAEQDAHPRLYAQLMHLLETLQHEENWLPAYVHFELALLEESGFGLDLEQCAATGTRENLRYISPKSGRAVSAEAGQPYHDRLLPFSNALRPELRNPVMQDIADGLRVTGFFLQHWLLESLQASLPAIRQQFAEILVKTA